MNPLVAAPSNPLLVELASRRHGVVGREELLDAGISPGTVSQWLRNGRIVQLFQGVYLVAGAPQDFMAEAVAAHLYVSRQARRIVDEHPVPHLAALSGTTAAWLHDFPWVAEPRSPYVVANRFSRSKRVRVGHLPELAPVDVTAMHGTLVTEPALSLLEAAAVLSTSNIENLLVELPRRGVLTLRQVAAAMQRHPESEGHVFLLNVLREMTPDLFRTRSGAERRIVRGLKARGLHGFEVNAVRRFPEARIEFDILDGDHAEELDGFHHLLPDQQRWDRERDRISRRHGINVERTTVAALDADPEGVIDAVATRIREARARRSTAV